MPSYRYLLPVFMAFVCLCWVYGVAIASPAQGNQGDNVYVSPTERQALAAIIAEQQEPLFDPANPPKTQGDMLRLMRQGFESFAASLTPQLPGVSRETQAAGADGVKGLWFKPKNAAKDRVLLYLHGGGYVFGSPITGAAVAEFLAVEAGVLCFALEYPLAPEAPYPAALNAAVAAYVMLLRQGFAPEHITLAGDSAGGGLALATLLRLREQGRQMPAGVYVLSPWADLSNSFGSHTSKRLADPLLNTGLLGELADMYVTDQERTAPLISPAFANLRGLPPILIQVGSNEILLDDAQTLAANAARDDVPVTLTVWPGYFHVFQMFYARLEGGRRALLDGALFLREATAGTLLRSGG